MSDTPVDRMVGETGERRDQERSVWYYVGVMTVMLLIGDVAAYAVVLFYNALHFMSPPFTAGELPWIISVTLLVGGALQPLVGKLSDVFGRKRLLIAIGVTFMIGSIVGAVTTSFPLMILARVLQASGVSISGVIYGYFRDFLPTRMVPVAVGLHSTAIGVAAVVAPLISGALLASFGYPAIFWFCFVYMGVLLPLAMLTAPEQTRRVRRRIDFLGSAFITLGVGLVLVAISRSSALGWTSPWTLLSLVVGLLLLALFPMIERRVRHPMIDAALLSGHAVRMTLLISLVGGLMIASWSYVIPQILETRRVEGIDYGFGMSALKAGVVTLTTGVASMICGPLGGYIARRTSPRLVMLWCCGLGVVATVPMIFLHDELWVYLVFGAIMGVSSGFYFAAGPNLIIDAVPRRLTGVSTGVQALSTSFAGALMPVVITAVLAANVLRVDSSSHRVVYSTQGYDYVFAILAAAGLVAFVITLLMRHGRAPATGGASLD